MSRLIRSFWVYWAKKIIKKNFGTFSKNFLKNENFRNFGFFGKFSMKTNFFFEVFIFLIKFRPFSTKWNNKITVLTFSDFFIGVRKKPFWAIFSLFAQNVDFLSQNDEVSHFELFKLGFYRKELHTFVIRWSWVRIPVGANFFFEKTKP